MPIEGTISRRCGLAEDNPCVRGLVRFWYRRKRGQAAVEAIVERIPAGDSRWHFGYLKVAVEGRRLDLIEDELDAYEEAKPIRERPYDPTFTPILEV